MLYHVFRDRCLGHLDSKLEQFAVQPWCAPQEIGSAHVANQIPDLPRNAGTTSFSPTTFPLPEELKSFSMPGDDGLRLDEHEALAPLRPEAGENDPQKPMACPNPEPLLIGSLQDNELVVESQDFHLQEGSRSQRGCKPGEYRCQHIAHGSGRYQRGIAESMICIATGFLAGTADQWMSLPGSG